MRVEEAFFRHAARRPEHPALVCGSQRLSYSELERKVRRRIRGGVSGERIPVHLPNSIEFAVELYAAWASGAVAVPINFALPAGYKLNATVGTTVANGYYLTAIGGKY